MILFCQTCPNGLVSSDKVDNFMEIKKKYTMQIQINTDRNVEGSDRLVQFYSTELQTELARFDDKITRVEVHFGDENSEKFSVNDKRCLIEVRLAKKQPLAVTAFADTVEKSFYAALEKAKKVLDTTYEKMREY